MALATPIGLAAALAEPALMAVSFLSKSVANNKNLSPNAREFAADFSKGANVAAAAMGILSGHKLLSMAAEGAGKVLELAKDHLDKNKSTKAKEADCSKPSPPPSPRRS